MDRIFFKFFRGLGFKTLILGISQIVFLQHAYCQSETALIDLSLEDLLNVRITTASKRQETLTSAPASVIVISKSDIRNRGYSILSDVLRDLPGMETVEHYFSEDGTLVPVRGVVGNNKIVVLINGARVNPPGGEDMPFRSDISVRWAEQIEVIYGPGSTLYGQDAISAVINIITSKTNHKTQVQALTSYGTHDYTQGFVGFSAALAPDEEAPTISGFAQIIDTGLTDFSKKYPDWWKNYSDLAPGLGIGSKPFRHDRGLNALIQLESKKNSLQLWYRDSSRSSAEGGYTPILQFVDEGEWHDSSLVLEAKNETELGASLFLDSTITYNRYEIDPETRYVFPISATELFLNDFKYGLGEGLSVEETIKWSVDKDLDILSGVVASAYDIIPKATIPGCADRHGNIVAQGGYFTYYSERDDIDSRVDVPRATDLNYQTIGAYFEADYRLSNHISIIGGARIDSDNRYSTNPFSPRAAIIYAPIPEKLTVKYIFSKAFVSPAPYFAYNVFDNGRQLNTSNPDLEPERAISNELNVTWNDGSWFTSLSTFYNQQSNLILVGDLNLPVNTIQDEVFLDPSGDSTRVLTHTVNGGSSSAAGVDIFGRYNAERLSLWASYSYIDFRSFIDGNRYGLAQISKNNVRFGLTYKILDQLTFTPSLVYRSTPSNINAAYGLEEELRNPYEINASLNFRPVEHLDLFLNSRNITDHHYALRGLLGPTPQETFSIVAGLRVSF